MHRMARANSSEDMDVMSLGCFEKTYFEENPFYDANKKRFVTLSCRKTNGFVIVPYWKS